MSDLTDPIEIRCAVVDIRDRVGFLNKIQVIMERFRTHIVCFDADKLSGVNHVRSAVEHAIRSFEKGSPISNTIEMEALLYTAGSRQTSIGASFGIHDGENRLYICCFPARKGVWEELATCVRFCELDSWDVNANQKKAGLMKLFEISEEELESTRDRDLEGLILERVALLDVSR